MDLEERLERLIAFVHVMKLHLWHFRRELIAAGIDIPEMPLHAEADIAETIDETREKLIASGLSSASVDRKLAFFHDAVAQFLSIDRKIAP